MNTPFNNRNNFFYEDDDDITEEIVIPLEQFKYVDLMLSNTTELLSIMHAQNGYHQTQKEIAQFLYRLRMDDYNGFKPDYDKAIVTIEKMRNKLPKNLQFDL